MAERQLCGGFSKSKEVTETEKAILESLREEIESKVGKKITKFNAVSYKSQVVAGTNYSFKVEIDDDIIHVKISKPLPHTNLPPQLTTVETGKTLEDSL